MSFEGTGVERGENRSCFSENLVTKDKVGERMDTAPTMDLTVELERGDSRDFFFF